MESRQALCSHFQEAPENFAKLAAKNPDKTYVAAKEFLARRRKVKEKNPFKNSGNY